MLPLFHGAHPWRAHAALATLALVCVACAGEQATMPEHDTSQDAALVAAIEQAGGRVIIGFKDVGASRGVDPQGRRLASDASVRTGKAFLRSLDGITIEHETLSIPAVIATIDAPLAGLIRRHPNTDYLEVSTGGTWPVLPNR